MTVSKRILPNGETKRIHGRPFQKGSPGRPLGAKNKTTLLKEKILNAALKINLDDGETVVSLSDKKRLMTKFVHTIPRVDVLKLGAGFVPKETKVEMDGQIEIGWIE